METHESRSDTRLALASATTMSTDSTIVASEMLALSDREYRHRQELINQHHSRGLQMNMAATYVLAVKFKQLDDSYNSIGREINTLKSGVEGQQRQVVSLRDRFAALDVCVCNVCVCQLVLLLSMPCRCAL